MTTVRLSIRAARDADWPGIWRCLAPVIAAGETLACDPAMSEEAARDYWLVVPARGRVVVAVDDDGTVLGTARSLPNQGGGGDHVANASFVVGPHAAGQGVGRALGRRVIDQARLDGFRAMQFNAVVETNARAVRLWRSLGFQVLTTVPEAFRHPRHGRVGLHVMHRRL
ncbi:GNAT family N-acetyltransferase [Solwaraspora sp. WMMD406]|uniref:GNAT family N-acetyltransferase n=1 Tax=Solwaraspora sp. WMMD406 TaxID=3016095 RepID=UPI0024172B25|nr:GNAT family N-acetyltransferase [Solwaraspora sp. WMMD406]MDG4766951.1 GNAT family N-acetyltransferase [Solwaraspora sp. WMMD406]